MDNVYEIMQLVAKERPVGSENNNEVLNFLEEEFVREGYEIHPIPFDCYVWESDESYFEIGESSFKVLANPFSKSFEGEGEVVIIKNFQELEKSECSGKIIMLCEEIALSTLMPKNYPFYYPEEHKKIITTLEDKKPAAIICVTGKNSIYLGLEPFYMFEDGNFEIPSSYIDKNVIPDIKKLLKKNKSVRLLIKSKNILKKSRQLIARKTASRSKGKIILCAHMDTKYNTPGALDNATGVTILTRVMQELKAYEGPYDIEFVPFSTEEYYEATGELKYLDYIQKSRDRIALVINVDSPCYVNTKTAVSFYNVGESQESNMNNLLEETPGVVKGKPWVEGDHSIFAFKGIPCLAVTSSNLFEKAIEVVHTQNDTLENIDYELLEQTSVFITDLINKYEIIES